MSQTWAAMIIGGMTDALSSSPSDDAASALPDLPPLTAWPATFGGAVALRDWGLIRAEGPDTVSFLQGQLTNDLTQLRPGQARLAGYCSPKGRLLASFIVWQVAEHDWRLACSAALLPATLTRRSMFVLRAKCKLSDVSATDTVWGVAGAAAWSSLGDGAPDQPWRVKVDGGVSLLRLPEAAGQPRGLLIQSADATAPALPVLAPGLWAGLEAASGVARISAATSEAFVPQMVNFELVGGVNFKKGCYPGQEVVARSQYRGTLKRRGVLLQADVPLSAGQEVFHSEDPSQPAGLLALGGDMPDGQHLALAEIKLAALTGGSLHLGAADGPRLQPLAPPYPVPADAA